MINFDQVSKRYAGGREALSRVNFEIPDAEMVFLTGHSGAGKSTLLKLIIVMERASQGQVFVQGTNLNRVSRRQIPAIRRDIGVVFQNHQLLFDRTVFHNVALPLTIAGYQPREGGRRAQWRVGAHNLTNFRCPVETTLIERVYGKRHRTAEKGGPQNYLLWNLVLTFFLLSKF